MIGEWRGVKVGEGRGAKSIREKGTGMDNRTGVREGKEEESK